MSNANTPHPQTHQSNMTSDTPRTDALWSERLHAHPFLGTEVEETKLMERELNAAIMFIKDLNATTSQPGRVYRAKCGKFLRQALKK